MILKPFIPFFEEIFSLEGLLAGPALVFGVQDISVEDVPIALRQRLKRLVAVLASNRSREGAARQLGDLARALRGATLEIPSDYARATHLGELLTGRGVRDVHSLDLFDSRASLRYDMNLPVPRSEWERFHLLLDVGSVEHVFDTRQCVENCMRMVRPGGFYLIHTPVSGYYLHGLHTFNPEGLLSAMTLNGFEIVYHRYASMSGIPLARPLPYDDNLIFLVGRKTRPMAEFKIPQQGVWTAFYSEGDRGR